LSLSRVRDIELLPVVTAHPGDDASDVRQRARADPFRYLLLVDKEDKPIGWIDEKALPPSGPIDESLAISMSPLLDRRTTLKDALSMLLDADVQAGIVVDRRGAVLGLVTVDVIAEQMRETAGDGRFTAVPVEIEA
jgi:osmoprotectant transport system ATP-binding protein